MTYMLPPDPMAPPPPAGKGSKKLVIAAGAFVAILILLAVTGTVAYKLRSSGDKTAAPDTSSQDSSSDRPSDLPIVRDQQKKARDSKRQTDIATIQTQLEAYFQNYGYYPSLHDMNLPEWRGAHMQSLDEGALADPSSSCDPANTACLTASPKAGAYSYAVTDSSGKSCEADDTTCAKYTLTATLETGGTLTKSNLD